MPVQVNKDKFVRFKYDPKYLRGKIYDKIRTKQSEVIDPFPMNVEDRMDILLDGGNVIKGLRNAILTDKVFRDNVSDNGEMLLDSENLKNILEVEDVIIIPPEKGDYTGHADGLVRFLHDEAVLVSSHTGKQNVDGSEYVTQSDAQKLYGILACAGLDILQVPYFFSDRKYRDPESDSKSEDYTAIGNYVNYMQIGDKVFVPQYYRENDDLGAKKNIVERMDKEAIRVFKKHFREETVIPVNSYDIALRGGVLNCITWNVFEPVIIDPDHFRAIAREEYAEDTIYIVKKEPGTNPDLLYAV
ncbi:MAG: agmatine deiminase family protein [Bacteroidales bacterium]|nr:agmatine deiminase family protein [Bacteroidales bacterium]